MTAATPADVALLEKLLLGQVSAADADRLAEVYADDSRLTPLAETLVNRRDTLLESLRHQQPSVDPDADKLARRLLERLKLVPRKGESTVDTVGAAAESSSDSPMPERLEYFRIEKVLGEGGMGTVYLAEDTRLGRQVALKTLKREWAQKPRARERFLQEARSAAKLGHDHIIPIYYVGEADGTPFLAMPLLKGESLRDCLRQAAGPLPVAQAVRIGREIATGLAAAHASGLIHRDIKPANIWLEVNDERGMMNDERKSAAAPSSFIGHHSSFHRVKILDFGLARAAGVDTHLTASGAIVGTPAYMSPEQGRGLPVDHRADLFSLGCILYQMLTGQCPFTGPDAMSILTSLAIDSPAEPHTLNPDCPPALSRLVMRLLEKKPDARPASAQAVVEELRAIESELRKGEGETRRKGDSETGASEGLSSVAVAAAHPVTLAPSHPGTLSRTGRSLVAAGVFFLVLAPLAHFFGGTVIRFATNQGELVIQVDDKNVEIKIVQNGVVVEDKTSKRTFTLTAGKGEIEVLEKDGIKLATRQFELTRGGKTTVKVTLQELADARKPKDPDRRAAEWVLSIGGTIGIEENGKDRQTKATGDLPRGAFAFTVAGLNDNPKVSDAGLANFKDCKNLTVLYLGGTQVGDAGLAHFKDCKSITKLYLSNTQVSNAVLAHLKHCKNLTYLSLSSTQVSDAGLAYLKNYKNLTNLDLTGTKVSDLGLAYLKECNNLGYLDLTSTNVSDLGLAHLKNCENLTFLNLASAQVSDAGMAYLKNCKNLTYLRLAGTQVIDAGLAHLKDCKNLTNLDLQDTKVSDAGLADLARFAKLDSVNVTKTKVTEAGVKKLSAALPGCKIEWDGGVIEPKVGTDPDRRAAEWVLSIGGTIGFRENGKEREIKAVGDLPRGAFELTVAGLNDNPKVSDAGLANFKDCKNLTKLHLRGTQVGDAGLAHFKDCKSLLHLILPGTQVGDAGLAHFKVCKNLTVLYLSDTQVGDAGLAHFKDCTNLSQLYLNSTQVSDTGLAYFKDCSKNLTQLNLSGTQVGDAGLAHFKDCKDLTHLILRGTQVSDAGVAHFKDCKNLAVLHLSDTQVSDAGPAQFKDCKNITHLNLSGTQVSDAGLAYFKDCKNLTDLWLLNTKVGDAGLAHFKDSKGLIHLHLNNSKVSDAGLAYFKDCKNLTWLDLGATMVTDAGLERCAGWPKLDSVTVTKTKVTAAGVKKLAGALPGCTIEWDGGVIEPKVTADPDRRAAEWVLSIGGAVSIKENGKDRQIKAVGDLPGGAFELTVVDLASNPKVSDAGLAHFKDCQNLRNLNLHYTLVSDLGLACFKDCQNLMVLNLGGTGVSDAGLALFKDRKNLTALILPNTQVSDAGLAHFKGCKNLTHLVLVGTQVSDAGLAHFKDCKNLTHLHLVSTRVSDVGLAHFKDCKDLSHLHLASTKVSDAGLAHFKDCKNLTYLDLNYTKVSDAGLADLTGLPRLIDLNLINTRISLHGCEQVKTALPKCAITWSEPNRSVAESVLALGGTVAIGTPGQRESRPVKAAADLPRDYFQVRRIALAGVAKPLAKLPELLSRLRFPEFDRLESIDLSGISGLNYDFLAPIHGLQELSLARAELNAATLANLPKLPALKRLVLDGNEISGGGIVHLSGRPELIDLSLGCPSLGDLLAKNLAELKQVKRLSLADSGLSDEGIKHLASLKNLEWLDLHGTKASAAGVAELQKALPKCKIDRDGKTGK